MRGWSWYDRRDGRRTTVATFLTQESAQTQLDGWRRYCRITNVRPDIADLIEHVEVRAVEEGE